MNTDHSTQQHTERDRAYRSTRTDRAVSWLAWWSPELAAVLLLTATALVYPVTALVTAPLAAVLLADVLGRPLAWRAWVTYRRTRERARRRRAERVRAEKEHTHDADDREAAG